MFLCSLSAFNQPRGCFAGTPLPSPQRFSSRLQSFVSGGVCARAISVFACFPAQARKKHNAWLIESSIAN